MGVFNIRNCQTVFPRGHTPCFSPARGAASLFHFSHPRGGGWYLTVGFGCISLRVTLRAFVSVYHTYSFFCEVSIQVFCPFLYLGCLFGIKLHVFFICVYMYSRYKSFFKYRYCKYFLLVSGLPIHFFSQYLLCRSRHFKF